jgi:hypothetical protein
VNGATPGQAAAVDPSSIGCRVQAQALNALTRGLAYEGRPVSLGEREAIADVIVAAIEPLIREDERAIAAQQPQPAPGPQPRPGYVTVDARDIAIALNGYAGFTGDPVSFASELHERLRRTVFAGAAPEPQPAPELAAAMRESRIRAEVINDILSRFGPSGSGHTARVGQVQIGKWRAQAGLKP